MAVAGKMHLGGEPAPTAPQRLVGHAQPLPFSSPRPELLARVRGVLMGAHHCRLCAHLPLDLPNRVQPGLRVVQQVLPGAVAPPAHAPIVAGLPRAVALGQVPSRRPSPQLPQNTVCHLAVLAQAPASPAALGQERLDPRSGLVGEFPAPDHLLSCPRGDVPTTGYHVSLVRRKAPS